MTRVLFCCSYFWPDLTGIALYATQFATHLAERGYEVTVVTGFAHYPSWRREPGPARFAASEVVDGVRVLRRWHYVPHRQSPASRAAYEASFLAGLTAVPRIPPPDVVVAMSPCLASAAVALAAGRRARAPVGVIFQDVLSHAAQSGIGGSRLGSVIGRLELAVARRAVRVGLTAAGFEKVFVDGGVAPGRIVSLRNWLERSAPATAPVETRRRLGWGEQEFVCLHAGNMGRKQNLESLIETAGLLDGVRIVLAGGGNERSRLERLAATPSAGRVSFMDVQSPGAYESVLEAADVLIVNQRATVTDMALPSKLTAYFAAGRPVVAAVAEQSETAAEVRRSRAGVVVVPEQPATLAAALTRLRGDEAQRARLAASGRRYAAEHLTREVVLPAWVRFVEETREAGRA